MPAKGENDCRSHRHAEIHENPEKTQKDTETEGTIKKQLQVLDHTSAELQMKRSVYHSPNLTNFSLKQKLCHLGTWGKKIISFHGLCYCKPASRLSLLKK